MPVPDGFALHDRHSPATAGWEPIYARHEADRVRLGIEVRAEHAISRGLVHGGVIATLADNAMGLSLRVVLLAQDRAPDARPVTSSLAIDYLGRATLGQWLEIDTRSRTRVRVGHGAMFRHRGRHDHRPRERYVSLLNRRPLLCLV